MAALYYDFSSRCDAWESREKQYKGESVTLHNERAMLGTLRSHEVEGSGRKWKDDEGSGRKWKWKDEEGGGMKR